MPNPVVPADDIIWVSMFFLESRFFCPKWFRIRSGASGVKNAKTWSGFYESCQGRQLSERSRQEGENRKFSTGSRILSSRCLAARMGTPPEALNGQPLPSLRSVQWPASQLLHALTLTCIISDKCLFSMGNEECNVV